MLEELNIYITGAVASFLFIIAFFLGYLLRWFFARKRIEEAEQKAKFLLDSAKKNAENSI